MVILFNMTDETHYNQSTHTPLFYKVKYCKVIDNSIEYTDKKEEAWE